MTHDQNNSLQSHHIHHFINKQRTELNKFYSVVKLRMYVHKFLVNKWKSDKDKFKNMNTLLTNLFHYYVTHRMTSTISTVMFRFEEEHTHVHCQDVKRLMKIPNFFCCTLQNWIVICDKLDEEMNVAN